jgi:hypothetical protein
MIIHPKSYVAVVKPRQLHKPLPSTFEAFEEYLLKELSDQVFVDFWWESSRGDYGKGFRKFSSDLGFVANNCVTHFAKMGELNGTHSKYIKNEAFLKDEEDGFKMWIMFISRQTNENFVEVLQDKLIEKLELMGEDKAVTHIKGLCYTLDALCIVLIALHADNWSDDNGRYTLAHSKGPGGR